MRDQFRRITITAICCSGLCFNSSWTQYKIDPFDDLSTTHYTQAEQMDRSYQHEHCITASLQTAVFHAPFGFSDLSSRALPEAISALEDTTIENKPKIRLLPQHLSLMETVLWGESGAFRVTGLAPLTPSARKKELSVRRAMLTLHQIGGFLTMGLMIPTLILGQRNINMWRAYTEGNGPYDRSLDHAHRNLGSLTFTSYMVTASLSLLSPPPLIRRDNGEGSVGIHKTLAWIHFAGMAVTPFLGYFAAKARSVNVANNWRTAHQVTAYVTAAAFSASLIVITF